MYTFKLGNTWAAITVIDLYEEDKKVQESPGITATYKVEMVEFRCECGAEWSIEQDAFPGRRKLKDCGCGAGSKKTEIIKGGVRRMQRTGETKVIVSTYLPVSLRDSISERAVKQNVSFNMATMELLLLGLSIT